MYFHETAILGLITVKTRQNYPCALLEDRCLGTRAKNAFVRFGFWAALYSSTASCAAWDVIYKCDKYGKI